MLLHRNSDNAENLLPGTNGKIQPFCLWKVLRRRSGAFPVLPDPVDHIQAGATLQQSHYSEPHVWNKEAPAVKKMMRTPNTYGYFTATYTPVKPLSIALSGTYTGSMLIPHEPVPGFLDKPITVNTEDFFDIALKAAYDFKLYKSMNLQVNAGIQNIFNAYQNDFDKGADRDSGYIYGPSLPRSFFAGVKISY